MFYKFLNFTIDELKTLFDEKIFKLAPFLINLKLNFDLFTITEHFTDNLTRIKNEFDVLKNKIFSQLKVFRPLFTV